MARTAKRHITINAGVVGTEPQHVDPFGAEERHAGFVGFRSDPAPGEVQGINEAGELLVNTASGVRAFRDGSLTFAGATA